MKRLIIMLFASLMFATAQAGYFIAIATTDVNLREGPSTDYSILCTVPKGETLFVDTDDKVGNFYHVVFVEEDISGYVHARYVKLIRQVEAQYGNILSPEAITDDYDPTVNILNNTNVKITVVLNSEIYRFKPHEERTVTLSPGTVKIRASSPGLIPYVGTDDVLSNYRYSWEFYIETRRNR